MQQMQVRAGVSLLVHVDGGPGAPGAKADGPRPILVSCCSCGYRQQYGDFEVGNQKGEGY